MDYNYKVVKSKRKTFSIEVGENGITVRAPLYAGEKEIENLVLKHKSWIDKQLQKLETRQKSMGDVLPLTSQELQKLADDASRYIPERVEFYAKKIGVNYNKITIRCQKTRWGSCSSKGNLSFNCLLMLTPKEVIDSVVVHELCHRKEMNHSKRFYDEVLRVFPDYKAQNDWLRKNGASIIARAYYRQ